jgi:pteridine reductase
VHVTDIAAERPMRGYAHYSVSKAGLSMLTRALAVELSPIRVCAVAPGTVAFPADFDDAARAAVTRRIPLGRTGTPEDVAQAVLFLTTAPFINGVTLPVDGGRAAVL